MRRIGRWLVFGGLAIVVLGRVAAALSPRKAPLGPVGGTLAACPPTPNCVASLQPGPGQQIAPLSFEDDAQSAQARLRSVLELLPRTTIVRDEPGYIAAESRSLLFGFVDDLDFLLDADAKVFHVRSAARLGRKDMGVNRARMEEIRRSFAP